MSVVDEVFYLLTVSLFILAFVLVIDLGLDIEKGRTPIFPTLAPMSLEPLLLACI